MPGKGLSKISLILGAVTTAALISINLVITFRYTSSDGKTQALFTLVDLLSYSWIYWLLIPAAASLILAILALVHKEPKTLTLTACLVGLVAIALVFIRFWWLLV
jgi:hypothetical protein